MLMATVVSTLVDGAQCVVVVMLPLCWAVVGRRERDGLEVEVKELRRRMETLDLAHSGQSREKDGLSKEVSQAYTNRIYTRSMT